MMTNETVELFPHDKVFRKIILPFVPTSLRPNHLTVLRFILTPFVLFFLWQEMWSPAIVLFLVAGFTDALDGSIARLRKQITVWGTIADPVADKLLIGSVVVLFVAEEVNPIFAGLIILIEVLIGIGAWYRQRRGDISSANNYGKIKMVLQVCGVSLLLFARMFGFHLVVQFGIGTLTVAIVFAVVSLLTYGF